MNKVLLYEQSLQIKARIKDIVEKRQFSVEDVTSTAQLLSRLTTPEDYALIILDVIIKDDDGFDLVKRIHDQYHGIPIVILTSENSRTSFVKGIQMGASDYILKPFTDEFLEERLVKLLHLEPIVSSYENQAQVMSVQEYLNKELVMAKKIGFEVTLCMSLFYKPVETVTASIEREYLKLSGVLYPKLKEAIFEQDVFSQYGSQSFLAILPMCDQASQALVEEKFKRIFDSEKLQNSALNHYDLVSVFVTYPLDGQDKDSLVESLMTKTRQALEEKKIASNDLN